MISRLRRFGTTLAFVGFVSILSSSAGAQAPAYVTQWGSAGNGNAQFSHPEDVAKGITGELDVADSNNHRIEKFGGTVTPTKFTGWGSVKQLHH